MILLTSIVSRSYLHLFQAAEAQPTHLLLICGTDVNLVALL